MPVTQTFYQLIEADTVDPLTGEVIGRGVQQFGWYDTWEAARAEQIRLAAEEEIGTRIEQVEADVPSTDDSANFSEDIPGEDMGRWNAWLQAA